MTGALLTGVFLAVPWSRHLGGLDVAAALIVSVGRDRPTRVYRRAC